MKVGEKKVGEIQVGEKTWSVKLKVGEILGHPYIGPKNPLKVRIGDFHYHFVYFHSITFYVEILKIES
jgi:hypothetical protein